MGQLKHFLLRVTVTLLFLLVPILGVWTFVKAPDWGLWFPEGVSTYAGDIDFLFHMITWMVTITFILTEGVSLNVGVINPRRNSRPSPCAGGLRAWEKLCECFRLTGGQSCTWSAPDPATPTS